MSLRVSLAALLCAAVLVCGQSSSPSSSISASAPASSSASASAAQSAASSAPVLSPVQTNGAIVLYQSGVSFAPSPLPTPYARSKAESIYSAFENLGRTTNFVVNNTINVGEWEEAEGMVRVGPDRYFISHIRTDNRTVKYPMITNGTDRTVGAGHALLTVLDGDFKRVATVNLSAAGASEWHTGGIDYDGRYIWANIAEYRPNSTFSLVRIDPLTLNYTTIARFRDHAGGPIHDTKTGDVYNLNWGSRNATVFNLYSSAAAYPAFTAANKILRNPSFFVDYQDCKFLGRVSAQGDTPLAFCTGFAQVGAGTASAALGGLAIVNLQTLAPIFEVPLLNRTLNGLPLTLNPSDVDFVDGHLRFWFLPDQPLTGAPVITNSTMYVVDAQINSPFEYGGGIAPT